MEVRLTPSARRSLLETTVALRERDRAGAIAVIERLRAELARIARAPADAREMGPPGEAVADPHGLRVYYRTRRDVLWVIATWWGEGASLGELGHDGS